MIASRSGLSPVLSMSRTQNGNWVIAGIVRLDRALDDGAPPTADGEVG